MARSRPKKRASTLRTIELLNNLGHGSVKSPRPGQSKDDTGSHDTEKPRSDDVGDTTKLTGDIDGGMRRSGRLRRSRGSTGVGAEPDMPTTTGDSGEDESEESSEDDGEDQRPQDESEGEGDEQQEEEKEREEESEDKDEGQDTGETRSEDVWGIMDLSVGLGETRRRSGRLRQAQRSTRFGAEPDMSTDMGHTGGDESGSGSGSESSEDASEEQDEDQDGKDQENGQDPKDMLYMFSEDEDEARRSQSRSQLPSPSAVNKQLTTNYGEDQDGDRSLQSGSRPPRPEVHIEIRGSASKPSVRQDESIEHDKSIQQDYDERIQQDESSSLAAESSESSSSESPQLHKRRRVVHGENKNRSRHVRISPHDEEDADAGGVDEKARDLQWMQKAMNLGQQRDNWLVVTTTAKELSRMADDPDGIECDDICAIIRGLRSLYGEMVHTNTGTRPSTATLTQCDDLFGCISSTADKFLDRVYYQATEDGPCGGAQDLMAEFDARVVPGLVRLIIACFRVYFMTPLLFSRLPEHLHRLLLLVRGLWVRTTSMKAQRIVVHGSAGGAGAGSAVKHGKAFGQAIHGILEALETGALRPRNSPRSDNDNVNRNHSQNGREWTRDEGLALIDGLQLYHGSDRYARIIERFGHRLRDRTQHDLHQKALQLHDKIRPTLHDEEHGRWTWLFSVCGDGHSTPVYDPS